MQMVSHYPPSALLARVAGDGAGVGADADADADASVDAAAAAAAMVLEAPSSTHNSESLTHSICAQAHRHNTRALRKNGIRKGLEEGKKDSKMGGAHDALKAVLWRKDGFPTRCGLRSVKRAGRRKIEEGERKCRRGQGVLWDGRRDGHFRTNNSKGRRTTVCCPKFESMARQN